MRAMGEWRGKEKIERHMWRLCIDELYTLVCGECRPLSPSLRP